MKILLSTEAGAVSGGGTGNVTIKAVDGSKARVTANVDSNGNRTNITINTD